MPDQLTQEDHSLAEELAQIRDEVILKIHLGKAEMRTHWEELETKWTLLQSRLSSVKLARDETLTDLKAAIKQLLHELTEGYARIRESLKGL